MVNQSYLHASISSKEHGVDVDARKVEAERNAFKRNHTVYCACSTDPDGRDGVRNHPTAITLRNFKTRAHPHRRTFFSGLNQKLLRAASLLYQGMRGSRLRRVIDAPRMQE
jgi:hypothetical protein